MRKSDKCQLATELKDMLGHNPPATLPSTIQKRAVIIDFMAYVRKVPIKTLRLKTYHDLFSNLWVRSPRLDSLLIE